MFITSQCYTNITLNQILTNILTPHYPYSKSLVNENTCLSIRLNTKCLFVDVVSSMTHQAVQTNCLHGPVCNSSDEIQKHASNAHTCFYIHINVYLYEICLHRIFKAIIYTLSQGYKNTQYNYINMLFSLLSQLKYSARLCR